MSPKVLDWMARTIVGSGDDQIESLKLIKAQPEAVKKHIRNHLHDLVINATIATGEAVATAISNEAAQEVLDHCKKIFAAKLKAIKI
jgi:hypothetical protein